MTVCTVIMLKGNLVYFFLEIHSSSLLAEEIYSNHLLSIFMQAELCCPLQ